MGPLLVLLVSLMGTALAKPTPQLTEEEFRARGRSLDDDSSKVMMISGYSQVRRQGGRAFNDNDIKFPTLTVKSPNQLRVDSNNKVRVNVASPVFDPSKVMSADEAQRLAELQEIAAKVDAINQQEEERFEQEKEMVEEQELAEEQEMVEEQELPKEEIQEQEPEQEQEIVEVEQTTIPVVETTEDTFTQDLTGLELNTLEEEVTEAVSEEATAAPVTEAAQEPVEEAVEVLVEEEGSGLALEPDMSLDIEEVNLIEDEDLIKEIEAAARTDVPAIDFGDIQEI